MQTIPLIYTCLEKNRLHAGSATYNDEGISLGDTEPVSGIDRLKSRVERGKVIAIDIVGMNKGRFNANFIEFCKVPGNDLWLMEPLYDDEDVLDVFMGNAAKVIFPYEFIRNDSVLPDILAVSDNCIPLVTCRKGICKNEDPLKIVRRLAEVGYHNIMVADMDGSLTDGIWESLLDECGGLIAYSPFRKIGIEMHILADDVFPVTRSSQ